MAAIRLSLILLALLGFFLVGAPLQLLASRMTPPRTETIPRLFCRTLLALARVRVVIRGQPAPAPVLVVANHVSWLDILALRAVAPVCFLAKNDVERWPIVSTFAALQGTVFVDRRRRRSIVPANRTMAARMAQGRPVLLFPEGTTVAGPEPGPFRSSHVAAARDYLARPDAATPAVAVQPTAIAYSAPEAAWVGDDALLPHLWRTLRRPPLACTVAFGAPIAFAAGADRKTVTRQARDAIVALLACRAAVARETVAREPHHDGLAETATGSA